MENRAAMSPPHEPHRFKARSLTATGFAARIPLPHAALAQLDRASVYGTEGCRFESCELRFLNSLELIDFREQLELPAPPAPS